MKWITFGLSSVLVVSSAVLACDDHKPTASGLGNEVQAATVVETANNKSTITVTNPRIRAVASTQKVTGAFMVLTNPTNKTLDLVAAHAAIAGVTELHETSMQADGVMKMHKIEKMPVPANGKLELKPGSYHIMLINLKQALEQGASYPINLTFSDGSSQTINAKVMDITH